MRYFIIAGEASGDIHGAGLIEALLKADPEAEIRFFGGDEMAAAAAARPDLHFRNMAYMGFSEVIRHLPDVRRNLALACRIVDTWRPDAFIAIDYPSFNFRVARHAASRGVALFYYIPPKVWAWKEHRVRTLKSLFNRIFCILPFEPEFYRRHGMDVDYVGNPSVAEVDRRLQGCERPRTSDVLALVPGSRISEIRRNLPVMVEVARLHPDLRPVIAAAPAVPREVYTEITDLPLAEGETLRLMYEARAALVTSGTATLECALAGTPQVAMYRGNGSRLTYAIMSRWLKIPYVTLPNLIAGSRIIPEMLMHHCNVAEVDAALSPLLSDSPERTAMTDGYALMRRRLGTSQPAPAAASAIVAALAPRCP